MFSQTPHSIVAIIVLLTLVLSAPNVATSQGYLHASGIYIVDGNENRILLRGMGLGGWLVPEGYMIGTSSFANSPTAFQNAVAHLVGDANSTQFFDAYRQKYVQRKDIDSLARWGFNSVRLPMHYALLSPTPGTYLESGFALIDSLLSWCEAKGLYLILDLHCAPGGQNKDNISDYQGPPSLWESATHQRWTAEIWKTLASRYATKHWIGGYDLLNETAWSFPSGNAPLRDLLVRITDSIRTVDKNHMVFAEGNWYATDFGGLPPAWDTNMAWSFHKYWNANDYNAVSSYLTLRATTQCPLWLGESGENSNQWSSDCITMMEQYNIGWSWWTLKKIESTSCPLSAKKSPAYDGLLKYWNGQASQPSVTDAMNALHAQVSLLDADLCEFRPDYLNALFGVPSPNQRKPYKDNILPGVVYAVDYDMGKNRISYLDADFHNTQGVGGPAYNSGGSYRNDGVDIERSSDLLGNGYNVGWTSAGEFLAYTVRVQTGGMYNISLRAASSGSGGSLTMLWDGGETPPLPVPSTGGWQNWQTVNMGNYVLDSGTHDFQLSFTTGGYNVSRITFTLLSAGVHADPQMPESYALYQNYPNPFNPTTGITYQIPALPAGRQGAHDARQQVVSLRVYDILGREVAVLVDEEKLPGTYSITWNASKIASGVYFYRLSAGTFSETRKMLFAK